MKFILFIPGPYGYQIKSQQGAIDFSPLFWFLTDETMTTPCIKEFILSNEMGAIGGNSFSLIRESHGDQKIIVGFAYPDENNTNDEMEIETQQLINIMDKWQELTSKKAKKIYLVKDNNKIYITEKLPNS